MFLSVLFLLAFVTFLSQFIIYHQQVQTPVRLFSCVSSFMWLEYLSLLYHERSHTREKPFHCKVCNRLSWHIKGPTQERNNIIVRSWIVLHQLTHSEEKPYHCKMCDSRFWSQRHMKGATQERNLFIVKCVTTDYHDTLKDPHRRQTIWLWRLGLFYIKTDPLRR